jgi:hypothetical protein
MTEKEMLDKIVALETRVGTLEDLQTTHMGQTAEIKKDTAELVAIFEALAGFWRVLEFIGKLSKPIAVVGAIFAAWFTIKGVTK